MRQWICGLGALLLVACTGSQEEPEVLAVKQFHLKDIEVDRNESEVVRGEKLKRLYGAVSVAQRRDRLGEYISVKWNGPAGRESEPVRIVLEYRQAATGSRVLTMEREFSGRARGTTEFQITGTAYQEGGRVLAWRIRLFRGRELVETRRSYMWD